MGKNNHPGQVKENMPIVLENLSLEITTRCNLSCNNCFALADLNSTYDMDFDTAACIVNEGFGLGCRSLHLTGGEPFLWKNLLSLLDLSCDLGYTDILINTNAILLSPRLCSELEKYRDKIILSCSLNGNEKTHDSIRGKGSYNKSIKGLTCALDRGLCVDVYTTVYKNMLSEIPVFVESLFKDFSGIRSMFFIQLRRVEKDLYPLGYHMLSPKEFITLVRLMGLLSLYGYPLQFLENGLYNVVASCLKLKWMPVSPVMFRFGRLMVLHNRNITANHSSRKAYEHYRAGILKQVLTGNSYKEDVSPDVWVCPACEYYEVCRSCNMHRPCSDERNDRVGGDYFCKRVLREVC